MITTHTSDGSQVSFPINIPFNNKEDVQVYIDNSLQTNNINIIDNDVIFSSPPNSGAVVGIECQHLTADGIINAAATSANVAATSASSAASSALIAAAKASQVASGGVQSVLTGEGLISSGTASNVILSVDNGTNANQIPKNSDLGSAAYLVAGTSSENLPQLDSSGKLLSSIFPDNIGVPTGFIMYGDAGSTVPSGWLKCDGSAISITTYANLFAIWSTRYGAGDGSTTFNLMDARGYHFRVLDDGRGIDSQPSRAIGSIQADGVKNHRHLTGTAWADPTPARHGTTTSYGGYITNYGAAFAVSTTPYTSYYGGTENTVKNIALDAFVKI